MTLIAALRCRDGVIVGSDSQETRGARGRRIARLAQKVYEPRPGFLLAWAGTQDVAQSFGLHLRDEELSPRRLWRSRCYATRSRPASRASGVVFRWAPSRRVAFRSSSQPICEDFMTRSIFGRPSAPSSCSGPTNHLPPATPQIEAFVHRTEMVTRVAAHCNGSDRNGAQRTIAHAASTLPG